MYTYIYTCIYIHVNVYTRTRTHTHTGIDATQFEQDGVTAEVLLVLTEEEFVTLGTGV